MRASVGRGGTSAVMCERAEQHLCGPGQDLSLLSVGTAPTSHWLLGAVAHAQAASRHCLGWCLT